MGKISPWAYSKRVLDFFLHWIFFTIPWRFTYYIRDQKRQHWLLNLFTWHNFQFSPYYASLRLGGDSKSEAWNSGAVTAGCWYYHFSSIHTWHCVMSSLMTLFHPDLRTCVMILKFSRAVLYVSSEFMHIRATHWHFRKAVSNLFEQTPWSVKGFEHKYPIANLYVYMLSYILLY